MVLVVLGTQDKEFSRLLEAVEEQIKKGVITEDVIVQAGQTKYNTRRMKVLDFVSRDDFQEYVRNSNYIITHGGVGTIIESLDAGKKIIAVPRLKQYGEHENDHQLQIIGEFVKRGYILTCSDLSQLGQTIQKLSSFEPKEYQSNNKNFISVIRKEIEKR